MYRLALLAAAAFFVSGAAEARQSAIGGGPTPSGPGAVIVAPRGGGVFGRSTLDTRIPPPLNGQIPPPLNGRIPQPFGFSSSGAHGVNSAAFASPRRVTSKIVITTSGATTVTITRVATRGRHGAGSALICSPTIGRDIVFTGASPRSTSDAVLIVQGNQRILVSGLGARPSVAHSRAAMSCARGLGASALVVTGR